MIRTLFLLWFAASPAFAQKSAQPQVPVQTQIINLSLLEALVAVGQPQLAGVFGFIPEDRAPMALADYLMHDRAALKRFIKKGEKDLKRTQGVNEWDKQVMLYLVGIDASGAQLELERLPKSLMNRIQVLSLAPPLPLEAMVQRRTKG